MVGLRKAFGAVVAVLLSCGSFGCGGSVEHGSPVAAAGGGQAGSSGRAGAGSAGDFGNPGRGGGGAGGTGGSQAGGPFVEPDPIDTGCPERPLPPAELACDPFASDCGPGLGCYPFVEHPQGNGCEPQRYGTMCAPAGTLGQGQSCGDGSGSCAPGLVCVVGQRAGKRCAPLCQLGKQNACTGGLLCADLDVAGFGVCG